MDAKKIIEALHLKPLPGEGGFFRETYRSKGGLPEDLLGGKHAGDRNISTAIFFMVTSEEFSVLHKLPQDEIFHFYLGDPVEMLLIDREGSLKKIILGANILEGEQVQVVVPGEAWQGLRLREGGQWALLGATVAPGFDFRDFVKGERKELLKQFPQHQKEILRFTRKKIDE